MIFIYIIESNPNLAKHLTFFGLVCNPVYVSSSLTGDNDPGDVLSFFSLLRFLVGGGEIGSIDLDRSLSLFFFFLFFSFLLFFPSSEKSLAPAAPKE